MTAGRWLIEPNARELSLGLQPYLPIASEPARSSRPEVRNPVLGLPEAAAMMALPADQRAAIGQLFRGIHRDANVRAEAAWRKSKPPMAAYWKATATYALHTARAIERGRR